MGLIKIKGFNKFSFDWIKIGEKHWEVKGPEIRQNSREFWKVSGGGERGEDDLKNSWQGKREKEGFFLPLA